MTPKAFWSQVKKQRSGCWLWMGKLAVDGYGIGPGGKPAHRFAWQLTCGEIPKGKLLLHSCHVRCCVKPKHLRPGTDAENAKDTYLSGRPMNEEKGSDFDIMTILEESKEIKV